MNNKEKIFRRFLLLFLTFVKLFVLQVQQRSFAQTPSEEALRQLDQIQRSDFTLNLVKPFSLLGLDTHYSGQLSGQYSRDLLFGSEQTSYGGYSTVRGLR